MNIITYTYNHSLNEDKQTFARDIYSNGDSLKIAGSTYALNEANEYKKNKI